MTESFDRIKSKVRQPICGPSTVATDSTGRPLVSPPPQWTGLPVALYPIEAQQETGPSCVASPMLVLALAGQGRRWYRCNGTCVELQTAPGMIELYGHEFQRDAARWEGDTGQSLGIALTRDDRPFAVKTTHELVDPKLQWLALELLDEAQRGAPSGALYAEGLSCALLGRLAEHYAEPVRSVEVSGQLSANVRRRIVDFIEERLGEEKCGRAWPTKFRHCLHGISITKSIGRRR